jgi:hypothetical protein
MHENVDLQLTALARIVPNGAPVREADLVASPAGQQLMDPASTQRKAQVAELIQMIEDASVNPKGLGDMVDDLVYDAKEAEGSSPKSEGLERELEYLLEVNSFEWLRSHVTEMIAECQRAAR